MSSLIDRRPPKWLATLFRTPEFLFRRRLGWVFGGRMLMLTHVGRRTGRARNTVLEVVSHQEDPATWYVPSAWGARADWYRNVSQNPRATVAVGRSRYPVVAKVVDTDHAAAIFAEYVRQHPWAARFVGRMIGVDLVGADPLELAERIPLVALAAEEAGAVGQAPVAAESDNHRDEILRGRIDDD